MQRHRSWAVALTFALLGPAVPGTVLTVVLLVTGGNVDPGAEFFWFGSVVAGYVFGGIPALLTGALAPMLSRRHATPVPYVAWSTAAGAILSSFVGVVVGPPFGPGVFAGFGALAALASASLTCLYRYKPSVETAYKASGGEDAYRV